MDVIKEFQKCNDLQELEKLADLLGDIGDVLAIEPLINRLGDDYVQEDSDVEDAVCDALVKLGMMKKIGNLNFKFKEESSMPKGGYSILEKYKLTIPKKYFQ